MRKFLLGVAAASVALFGLTASANAVIFFKVEPNPGGTKLFLDLAKDSTTSKGTVVTNDDVTITTNAAADFASGFSTIKPASKDFLLTTLTFTPTDPTEFNSFSFRGQDLVADQVIDVTILDNFGNSTLIAFTEGKANQDFARQGIIAAVSGETIKSVTLFNSGGFKEAKQFEFNLVGQTGGIPEPAVWLMMIAGFGLVGAAMRSRGILAKA
ncbi:MAG TPA: PEPxxWA-CTERM sorting domain-containing protein [Rhizomicrobium sp.]|nr:PEPxxWA-CTERM sorting domain-containing protein [Rhizomicrobium sp.]